MEQVQRSKSPKAYLLCVLLEQQEAQCSWNTMKTGEVLGGKVKKVGAWSCKDLYISKCSGKPMEYSFWEKERGNMISSNL